VYAAVTLVDEIAELCMMINEYGYKIGQVLLL